MHILHLNQRNQILIRYLRDKEKKKEGGSEKKGGGVKIHPFHLPWIRACPVFKYEQNLQPNLCFKFVS